MNEDRLLTASEQEAVEAGNKPCWREDYLKAQDGNSLRAVYAQINARLEYYGETETMVWLRNTLMPKLAKGEMP